MGLSSAMTHYSAKKDVSHRRHRGVAPTARRLAGLVRVAGLVFLAVQGLPACGTVDVGPETGPPQGCNAPSTYFVSDVWPRYFARYGCGQSACHDAVAGRGYFRLLDVSAVTAPSAMAPQSAWPFEWQQNLRAVQQNLSCANPLSSVVLAVPSGRSNPHPPGQTVTDVTDADLLFTTWLQ